MGLPQQPVTFHPAQVEELNRQLADMRHNVNNYLSLVTAAGEIILHKPELVDRMVQTLIEQPQRITEEMQRFSCQFEKAFSITRDP